MRRDLPRDTEWWICGSKDFEDCRSGEPDETRKGEYGRLAGCTARGHGLTGWGTAFLQRGDCVETRVMSVYPQDQWRVLPQRHAGDRRALDRSWEHHRVSGEEP